MIGWFGTVLVLAMLMRPSSSVQQTWPEATVFPQQLTESRGGTQKLESPFGLTRDFGSYLTTPADVPPVTVTASSPEAADGYVFLAPYNRFPGAPAYSPYLLILDGSGELVYHQRVAAAAEDFKRVAYDRLIYTIGGSHTFVLMDETYQPVDTIFAANGYEADFHDIQIQDDGTILLLIYEERQIDMSQVVAGGDPNAIVVGCRIQALDETRQVIFEWTSFDHFDISDGMADLQSSRIDYVHCNAIERDFDGDLLLTCRETDEVAKIDWDTGEVLWRLGGKGNQFEFVNEIGAQDVGFARHHDARRVSNGNITLFDNRMGVSNYSRAVEYALDEINLVATLVWEYRHSPDVHGHIMGNAQRLANGNTVIGWGSALTTMTEVAPDGDVAFELELPPSMQSYRAFKYPRTGRPKAEPTLIVESQVPTVTLTYSWNGATDVAACRVYGDTSDTPTTLIAVEPRVGFETTTVITDMKGAPFNFRVVPLNGAGQPMIPDPGWTSGVWYLPLVTR